MYLTLDGTEVLCASAEHSLHRVGTASRAFGGARSSAVRARKREWTLATVPLPLADVEALRALLEGDVRTAAGDFDPGAPISVRGRFDRVSIVRLADGLHGAVEFTLMES